MWRCGLAVTWEEDVALGTFVGTVFVNQLPTSVLGTEEGLAFARSLGRC